MTARSNLQAARKVLGSEGGCVFAKKNDQVEVGAVVPETIYLFHEFRLERGAHVLARGSMRIALQEQPFQVLLALLERPGEVVTREQLRLRLWGTSTFVDFDQSLNSAVRRLRLALEDNSRVPVFVETLPRVGFRFLPEVRVCGAELVKAGLPALPETMAAAQVQVTAPRR